ncbi:endonuclease V isoform X1 [Phalaenopsis equestris]|uniref:endonuclease V isoform X1 n=1 Tax=Phalaenopsis equestris TaxID=78828 RepID=UPI0009E63F70|nr:endonuclease V isoform X1 [Phalaenopsis equestris]
MDSSSKNLLFEGEGTDASSYKQEWIEIQENLKQKVVLEDDFTWIISPQSSCLDQVGDDEGLKYIGGVDVSFVKEDPSLACGALVVLDASNLNVVHEEFKLVRLKVPYVPGFLAFREAPIILEILDKMKQRAHPFYPQLLMVDGNGILHPNGFGLACHLGVLSNIPAIGIGKNLHHVDGLNQSEVRQFLEAEENSTKNVIPLVGKSGQTWGAAMRSTPDSLKPIYISPGHRISIDSSVRIVKLCCKFRVPEPIRQADIRSRLFLQNLGGSGNLTI